MTALYILAALFASYVLHWPIRVPLGKTVTSVVTTILALGGLGVLIAVPAFTAILLIRAMVGLTGRVFPLDPKMLLARIFAPDRLIAVAVLFGLYSIFISVFIAFKQALPVVVPFRWDVAFMEIDRWLHAGREPWRILQPLLGRPSITNALDVVYYLWFPINFTVLIGFMWVTDRTLRVRLYSAFWLVWIVLGTVMAYALSSAGPCYFGWVTEHPDPYASLMNYLAAVDRTHGLIAVTVHAALWADYVGAGANVLVKGISAMPSIHVALPALYTLAGWRVHRGLGVALGGYTVLIFLGSVHLAWHYAIDGYLSILAVVAVWALTGRVVRWARPRLLEWSDDGIP